MKLRIALTVASCLALPLVAQAQPVSGYYVSAGVGASLPMNQSTHSGDFSSYYNEDGEHYSEGYGVLEQAGRLISHLGAAAQVGGGYGFGNGIRVELMGNFERHSVHKLDVDNSYSEDGYYYTGNDFDYGQTGYAASGNVFHYGPMANVLYDFPVKWPVTPYLGVGVGYQWTDYESLVTPYSTFGDPRYYSGNMSGTRGSFAYNLIAGASYPIPRVPGLSLTLQYQFTQLTANEKLVATSHENDGEGYSYGASWDISLGQQTSHTVMVGLRYEFGTAPKPVPQPVAVAAAPPVAAPVPAPAPARSYLVFFDWDKSDLTIKATQIIDTAAEASLGQKVTSIAVSGYTDASGTVTYNQALSIRRAKAVAAKLVTDGVPATEIDIKGFGESNPLVPTAPGVREPQNRRVEIVLN